MQTKPQEYTFHIIVLMLLVAVIAIMYAMLYQQANDTTQRVEYVGTRGVVRADVTLEAVITSNSNVLLRLTMRNLQHEENKNVIFVPVIIIGDHVCPFTDIDGTGRQIYTIPGSEVIVYRTIENPSNELVTNINSRQATFHVSLWTDKCLEEIGFGLTNRDCTTTFQNLVKSCSSSYLSSFDIPVTFAQDGVKCEDIRDAYSCNRNKERCYYLNGCKSCGNFNTMQCSSITEPNACYFCTSNCKWINSDGSDGVYPDYLLPNGRCTTR